MVAPLPVFHLIHSVIVLGCLVIIIFSLSFCILFFFFIFKPSLCHLPSLQENKSPLESRSHSISTQGVLCLRFLFTFRDSNPILYHRKNQPALQCPPTPYLFQHQLQEPVEMPLFLSDICLWQLRVPRATSQKQSWLRLSFLFTW